MEKFDLILNTSDFTIQISQNLNNTFHYFRQSTIDAHEAFGVLIGYKTIDEKYYNLTNLTTPQKNDVHTRNSFKLLDPRHQQEVDAFFEQSNGRLGYLGTWHTHPEKNPFASIVDLEDWNSCITRNNDRKLFFIIIGIEKRVLYFRKNKEFKRVEF